MPHPFADLARCILPELGSKAAIQVVRRGAQTYDEATGLASGAATSTVTTEAIVQPSTPREVERLPENERTREAITIFTRYALRGSFVNTQQPADEVIWESRRYTVRLVEPWEQQARYARAIAVRVSE